MKINTSIFKTTIIVLFSSICFLSCEEHEFTTLPPETQTGQHTFGCYVNGRLFVHGNNGWNNPSREIEYDRATNVLTIYCRGKDEMGRITIKILNPEEKIKKSLASVEYSYWIEKELENNISASYRIEYQGANIGEILLTRFDTLNIDRWGRGIVSGVFSGEIPLVESVECRQRVRDPKAQITRGRFDFRLIIRN